jgi:hypothetical protein
MGAITIFSATAWIRERALLSEYIIRHATQGARRRGEEGGGLLHNFPWTHAALPHFSEPGFPHFPS